MLDPNMIFNIPAILIALTIHEYAHARAAVVMGDLTPRLHGRLTLNPIPHLDPIGLIMFWLFHFGWAKPVPINPGNFANRRKGTILVSLAGPLSNFLLALLTAIVLALWNFSGLKMNMVLLMMLFSLIKYNIILGIFNLLPIPPLDGSKVLMGFLPVHITNNIERFEPYGPFLLIALIYLGVISFVTNPLYNGFYSIVKLIIY